MRGEVRVKFGIEHADYLRGLVGDDTACFGVIEGWYQETSGIIRVLCKVDVA